jgi:hypothetical protein
MRRALVSRYLVVPGEEDEGAPPPELLPDPVAAPEDQLYAFHSLCETLPSLLLSSVVKMMMTSGAASISLREMLPSEFLSRPLNCSALPRLAAPALAPPEEPLAPLELEGADGVDGLVGAWACAAKEAAKAPAIATANSVLSFMQPPK